MSHHCPWPILNSKFEVRWFWGGEDRGPLPFTSSLSTWLPQPGLGQAEGTRSFIVVSHLGTRPHILGPFQLLSQLAQKWHSQDSDW